jgi:hypothetical protein
VELRIPIISKSVLALVFFGSFACAAFAQSGLDQTIPNTEAEVPPTSSGPRSPDNTEVFGESSDGGGLDGGYTFRNDGGAIGTNNGVIITPPGIPPGAVRYVGGLQECEAIFLGYYQDTSSPEIWRFAPDDFEERYERFNFLYVDRRDDFHHYKNECNFVNLKIDTFEFVEWVFDADGGARQLPTLIALIMSIIGIILIFRSGFQRTSDRSGFSSNALKELKKILNYEDNASGLTSETSLDWLDVMIAQLERLDREDRYQVRRVRLLQGIAIVLLGLAVALLSNSATLVFSNGIPNFATSFVITFPFALLLFSAGYLTNQSNKALELKSKIRIEINDLQIILARGLAVITSQIDVEKIFMKAKQKQDEEDHSDQPTLSQKELTDKLKELAKILAYWQKFGA